MRTAVRCTVGVTDRFKVWMGLNQGSALGPFLFEVVMDRLSDEVRYAIVMDCDVNKQHSDL